MPRLLALTVAAFVALLLTAPQASSGDGLLAVRAATQKDGQYTGFIQNLHVPVGEKRSAYWRVKSKTEVDLEAFFNDAATPDPNPEGYKIRWYKGKRDITSEVKEGAGFPFILRAGKAKTFRATVKHVSKTSGFCLGGQAYSTAPPSSEGAYFGVDGDPCN